jgi:hypothetical protein
MAAQWGFDGNAAYLFSTILRRKAGPEMDRKNINVAARLTTKAKQNLEDTRLRDAERGSRPRSRLTGTLTGHSGRSSAIRGNALFTGVLPSGGRQGKGVGWPRVDILERRARHWRVLEFGTPYVTMPLGVFLRGGVAVAPGPGTPTDVFYTHREVYQKAGLRRGTTALTVRQRNARRKRAPRGTLSGRRAERTLTRGAQGPQIVGRDRRGGPIEAKHFLENAWNEIVGPNGEKAFGEQVKIIEDVFREFRSKA